MRPPPNRSGSDQHVEECGRSDWRADRKIRCGTCGCNRRIAYPKRQRIGAADRRQWHRPARTTRADFEPYVTTRKTGSGLGLAIVKKILEEHGATIEFADNPGGGTVVTTVFPETLFATDIHSSSAPFPAAADE
ncbi:MAG: hypothetical protein IPP23_12545 [Sphingomonadales bacterium]|nr:hypothetical protein [Sphingomonadales bacterium]